MKVLRLVFGVFFVIGLGMLIGSYFTIQHTRSFLANAVTTEGVVIDNVLSRSSTSRDVSYTYHPRVQFRTADGRSIDFVSSIGTSPPSYAVNQRVTVLYDPQNPTNAHINSFASLWVATMVLGILGVVFTCPMIVLTIWQRASDQKDQWLRQNGQRIQAELKGVELNYSLEVNNRHPYRIVCQYFDPLRNQVHVFHSKNIWFDPTQFLPGRTIDVLFDPDRPHRYLVETSFLPEKV